MYFEVKRPQLVMATHNLQYRASADFVYVAPFSGYPERARNNLIECKLIIQIQKDRKITLQIFLNSSISTYGDNNFHWLRQEASQKSEPQAMSRLPMPRLIPPEVVADLKSSQNNNEENKMKAQNSTHNGSFHELPLIRLPGFSHFIAAATLVATQLINLPLRAELVGGNIIPFGQTPPANQAFTGGSLVYVGANQLWGDYFIVDTLQISNGTIHDDEYVHVPAEPAFTRTRTRTANLPPVAVAALDPDTHPCYFAFVEDGTNPDSMRINCFGFSKSPASNTSFQVDNIPSVGNADPEYQSISVDTDNTGSLIVAFPENIGTDESRFPIIRGRYYTPSGTLLRSWDPFNSGVGFHTDPDIAALQPDGQRVVCTATGFPSISLSMADFTGASPIVNRFPIDTTFGAGNRNPSVAVNPLTGGFCVVWEHMTGDGTEQSDIRARRFDSNGNPLGADFLVNTHTAGSQDCPDVAYGPDGSSAMVWCGDAEVDPATNMSDVFARLFKPDGTPAGDEFRVNDVRAGQQDQPEVAFIDTPNGIVSVAWRDVTSATDQFPNGTGMNYRCYENRLEVVDTDGDGQPDDAEIASGYDPNDPLDWFRIESITIDTGNDLVRITVPDTNTGFTYSLVRYDNLSNPPVPVAGQQGIEGNGNNLIFTDGFESGDTTMWSVQSP